MESRKVASDKFVRVEAAFTYIKFHRMNGSSKKHEEIILVKKLETVAPPPLANQCSIIKPSTAAAAEPQEMPAIK